MEHLPLWKRRLYFYTLLAFFAVALPVIVFLASGYRLKDGRVVGIGGISLYVAERGTEVRMNGRLIEETTLLDRRVFIQNLNAGIYTISVSKAGFRPWQKSLAVRPHFVTRAEVLLIPEEFEPVLLTKTILRNGRERSNIEYERARSLFEQASRSLRRRERDVSLMLQRDFVLTNEDWAVFAQGTMLTALWLGSGDPLPGPLCQVPPCSREITVFDAEAEIISFDWFGERQKAIIVSTLGLVRLVELDVRPTQHVFALYDGEYDDFRVYENETLFIKVSDELLRLRL